MHDALCTPRPIQARLPILIGGSGPTKTLLTTARHADLWNGFGTPERIAATSDVLRERCEEIGRTFDEIERTVTVDVIIRDSAVGRTGGLGGHGSTLRDRESHVFRWRISWADGRRAGRPTSRTLSTRTGDSVSVSSSSSSVTRSTSRPSSASGS